jgi:hypothetical protein
LRYVGWNQILLKLVLTYCRTAHSEAHVGYLRP